MKFGYPDATAIAKAEAALKALGFNVFKPIGGEYNANQIALHFGSNGFGVGYIDGNPGHSVFLTGYKSPSNTFTYYDSVKGGYGSRTGMDGIWLFFN